MALEWGFLISLIFGVILISGAIYIISIGGPGIIALILGVVGLGSIVFAFVVKDPTIR